MCVCVCFSSGAQFVGQAWTPPVPKEEAHCRGIMVNPSVRHFPCQSQVGDVPAKLEALRMMKAGYRRSPVWQKYRNISLTPEPFKP